MLRRLLACVLVLTGAGAADAPEHPDANALLAKIAGVAAGDAYPRYASYQVNVAFRKDGRRLAETWDTTEDLARGVVRAATFSLEERANPYTPHGINFGLGFNGEDVKNPLTDSLNHIRELDPVGPVAFAVDQRFGLARHAPYRAISDDESMANAGKEIPLIGRTGTVERLYDATWVDSEAGIDHIKLVPIFDPGINRLRELWFDHTTLHVETAVVAGIGNRPPMSRVLWQIDYIQRDGGTYIADELALDDVDFGKDGLLEDMVITFANLRLSTFTPLKTTFGLGTPIDRIHDP